MLSRRTSPSRARPGALSALSRVRAVLGGVWRSGSVARLFPLIAIAGLLGAGQACSGSSSVGHDSSAAGTSAGNETAGRSGHSTGAAGGSYENSAGAAMAPQAGANVQSTGGDHSAGGDHPASIAGTAGEFEAATGGHAGAPAVPVEIGGADQRGSGASGTGAAGTTQIPAGHDAGTEVMADAGDESGTSGAAGFPSAPDPSGAGASGEDAGTGGEQTSTGGAEGEPDAGKPSCTPSSELCDGLDNDCDGEVDENDTEQECDTGLLGVYAQGEIVCTNGVLTCSAATLPGTAAETCNGEDDDCDGTVDEGNPPGGDACSTGLQTTSSTPSCTSRT